MAADLRLPGLRHSAGSGAQLPHRGRCTGAGRRTDRGLRGAPGPALRRPRDQRTVLRGRLGGPAARGERGGGLDRRIARRRPGDRRSGRPRPGPQLGHRRPDAVRARARRPVPRPLQGTFGQQVRPADGPDRGHRRPADRMDARGVRAGAGRPRRHLASADLRQRRPAGRRSTRSARPGPVRGLHARPGTRDRPVGTGRRGTPGAQPGGHPRRGGLPGDGFSGAPAPAERGLRRARHRGRHSPRPRQQRSHQPLRDDDLVPRLRRVPGDRSTTCSAPANGARHEGVGASRYAAEFRRARTSGGRGAAGNRSGAVPRFAGCPGAVAHRE